ncbi:MAG: EAL domain-containing response regulator [Vicinamibacteria bacterium]
MSIQDMTFLIVDDHEFQREVLTRALAGLGATKILTSAHPLSTLAVIKESPTPADLVLIDCDIPGLDIADLAKRLLEGGSAASLVLISAMERSHVAQLETATRSLGVKVLGAIEKPVSAAKLAALIGLQPQTVRPHLNRLRATGPSFSLAEIVQGLKNDEFEPVFQPKVSLTTGRMLGAEALARWRHPQEGLIAPYAFIQTLENNGLIDSFTFTMLKKSAAFCRRWRFVTGFDVQVAVNISIKSLLAEDLPDRLTELVQAEGVEPKRVILEIAESAGKSESGVVLKNLHRLAAKGFGLSMDDYGTGASSAAQLTRIPLTELKVDRSLVTNACNSQAGRDLLKSTLDLARTLKISSVAQGVETQEDWDLLRQIGCDMAQGYFIAKPMDEGTFLRLTRDRTLSITPEG